MTDTKWVYGLCGFVGATGVAILSLVYSGVLPQHPAWTTLTILVFFSGMRAGYALGQIVSKP